jgi:hypothetical protein
MGWARATLVGLVFAAMVAGIVWFGVVVPQQRATMLAAEVAAIRAAASQVAEPATEPSPRSVPPAPVTVEPSPSPSPSPTSDEARLVELRKTGAFLEFAEYPRALEATWLKHGYASFAPHVNHEIAFEWVNKPELWNDIVPPLRDEVLLAGPEASRPMWNADVLIPAGLEMSWPDEVTGGRGQFVYFSAVYRDVGAGEPVERFWPFLIAADEAREGRVVARMPAFELREADSSDYRASRKLVRDRMWQWVQQQSVVNA